MERTLRPVVSASLAPAFKAPGSRALRTALLSGSARIALMALPAIVPLGVALVSTPAEAQQVVVTSPTFDNPGGATITSSTDGNGSLQVQVTGAAVTNEGTIINTSNNGGYGVYFQGGGSLGNSGLISGGHGAYFDGDGTVTNSGTIIGTNGHGVWFDGGLGTLTNTGSISGNVYGVYFEGSSGTLSNTNPGTIYGQTVGVFVTGATVNIGNTGTISGGNKGVYFRNSTGTLTNGGSISGGTYGVLVSGGSVTIDNTGTISSVGQGVAFRQTGGLVSNSGSIGGGSFGIYLSPGNSAVNTGTITSSGNQAIYSSGASYISNSAHGVIAGSSAGIQMNNGSTAVNFGTISGFDGISAGHNTGSSVSSVSSIANSGTITAVGAGVRTNYGINLTNNVGAVINAGTFGVSSFGGYGAYVDNSGHIQGTQAGVYLTGGTAGVTNETTGTITGNIGVEFQSEAGSLVNNGLIQGTQLGVFLHDGSASLTNASTGTITGYTGVYVQSATGSLINQGTITGTGTNGYGVSFHRLGASLYNAPNAVISGGLAGVHARGYQSSTITNAGTIVGNNPTSGVGVLFQDRSGASAGNTLINSGTIIGNSGTAVRFASGDDVLILNSGASFGGQIVDGGAGNNTLAISVSGTITNGVLPTNPNYAVSLTGFGSFGAAASGATLTNVGSLGGGISLLATGAGLYNAPGAQITGGTSAAVYGSAVGVTAVNAGTISSGSIGVEFDRAGGFVSNSGSIGGAFFGIFLNQGGSVVNTGTISGSEAVAFDTAGYISNSAHGVIIAGNTAIQILNGSTVVNFGSISGSYGISNDRDSSSSASSVSSIANSGTIIGSRAAVRTTYGINLTNNLGGVLNGGTFGVSSFGGYGAYVDNSGHIQGTRAGVYLTGGTAGVTNETTGTITGNIGVEFQSEAGSLVNNGLIQGTQLGVFLHDGSASLTNASTGTITGYTGVYVQSATGSLINQGTITGTGTNGYGVSFHRLGASLYNAPNAVISGGLAGVHARGYQSFTITNAGTIVGNNPTSGVGVLFEDRSGASASNTLINSGTIIGNSGTAVRFASGNDVLVLDTGASFGGQTVDGGAGINTLAVGDNATITNGTFANISGNFVGFTVFGATANATLTNAGTLGGQISLIGSAAGVVNLAGAQINTTVDGTDAVVGQVANVTVANYGAISATGSAADGVRFTHVGTVSNAGSIAATGLNGAGIALGQGGLVSNLAGGQIAGTRGIVGGGEATVANAGTISGLGTSGLGIYFNGHTGTLTNGSTGSIYGANIGVRAQNSASTINSAGSIGGGTYGIRIGNGTSTVVNSGLVSGGTAGISDNVGSAITNTSGGTIQGTGTAGIGVLGTGNGMTLVNAGTIIGQSGTAVRLGSGSDFLGLQAGASFGGEVVDGGGGINTLAIGGNVTLTNGTLSNAASLDAVYNGTFVGFTRYGVAAGGTLTNVGVTTSPLRVVGTGATLINSSGAVISTAAASTTAVTGVGAVTVSNLGTIATTGAFSYGIDLTGGQIANAGTITTTGNSANGIYLRQGLASNDGVISASGVNASGVYSRGNSTLVNGGTIVGNVAGVRVNDTQSTDLIAITNTGTITGVNFGVYASQLTSLTNTSGLIQGGTAGVKFSGSFANTLVNGGTIIGGVGVQVVNTGSFPLSNTLSNSGTIIGTSGTAVSFGGGNDLLKLGTGASFGGGTVDGGAGSNTVEIDGNLTLSNGGTVADGTLVNFGVFNVGAGGSLTNAGTFANNSINLIAAGAALYNPLGATITNTANAVTGSAAGVVLTNAGSILNTGTAGGAVALAAGGSIANLASGLISGVQAGIAAGGTNVVSNAGTIVANGGNGVGVVFTGTVGDTLFNSGTIIGAGGTAVQFGNGANTLQLTSTGSFTGVVNGGTGTNLLELTGTGGTVTGIGTEFVNFGTVALDGNAAWTVTGSNTLTGGFSLGAGAVLTNAGTIAGSVGLSGLGAGFINHAGASVISGTDAVIGTAAGVTVTNAGVILANGTAGSAVALALGGSVTNATGASLTGAEYGIKVAAGLGTIVNAGSITGVTKGALYLLGGGSLTNNAGGVIIGNRDGADFYATVSQVTNAGVIQANGGVGVYLQAGGTVTNQTGASITSGSFAGVFATGIATVVNSGTIAATGSTSLGVFLDQGGSVSNLAGGVISGVNNGIYAKYATATVSNAGTITGTVFGGVDLRLGGSVTNLAGGVISGTLNGVYAQGATNVGNAGTITANATNGVGVLLAAGGSVSNSGGISGPGAGVLVSGGVATVTNTGTIAGGVGVLFTGSASGTIDNFGAIIGNSGTAVRFAGGTNELIIEAGGVLSGLADGSAGTSTLLLNGGTLASAQVVGFQSVVFGTSTSLDSSTSVTNANVGNGMSVSNAGTLDGTLTIASGGTVANSGVINTGSASTNSGSFSNSGTVNNSSTLTNTGSLNNTGSLSNTGSINNSGSLANAGSLTNSGTITGSGTLSNTGTFANSSTGSVVGDTNGIVGSGSVANAGTIIGTTGTGVMTSGTITNMAGGYIKGGTYGVMLVAGGSVTNAGTILDDAIAGASLGSNSSFSNAASGTVGGVIGVIFTGTGASFTNNGIINGTGGVAVQFDAGVNTLTLGTGSLLTGSIDGGNGAGLINLVGTGALSNTIGNFGTGSALAVASGADWTATGTWTIANVTNAGTFQAGDLSHSLNLTGNFTQASTGTLRVALDAGGTGSFFNITGTAALAGSVAVVPSGTFLAASTPYTILSASGGVTGTFSSVNMSSALLVPTLSYDAKDAIVTLSQLPVASPPTSPPMVSPPTSPPVVSPPVSPPTSPPVVSPPVSPPTSPPVVSPPTSPPVVSPPTSPPALVETANQHAVAVAFDAGLASNPTGFATAIRGLDQLNAAGVTSSLTRLSGESHASLATTALQTGTSFTGQFSQQAALARLGASGTASGQSAMAAGGRQELARLDGGSDDPIANIDKPWGVWTSGYGQVGQLGGDGNVHRLDETIAGGSVGADYKLTRALKVGAALGYGGTTFSLDDGGGRGQVDHTQFALYADYTLGPVYLDGTMGVAYGDGTTRRNVSLPGLPGQAAAHVTDTQLMGSIEAGYGLKLGTVTATPYVGLAIGSVDQDGFTETGAGVLDLHVAKQSQSSVKSTVGARISTDLALGSALVTTDLSVGWAHEFAPTGRGTNASFVGAPAAGFQVAGVKVPGDSALIGFGLATAVFANTSIYAHYDGDLASGASSNAITAGFRFNW